MKWVRACLCYGTAGSTFFITLAVVGTSQPKNASVFLLRNRCMPILLKSCRYYGLLIRHVAYFYLWSGEENSSNNAYNRNFNTTNSNWNNNNRNNSNNQAVCLGDEKFVKANPKGEQQNCSPLLGGIRRSNNGTIQSLANLQNVL